MPRLLNVSFQVGAVIREDKETACFVSYCPALDLYSAGRTRPEARKALLSAVDMYVRICYQRNILGKVLHAKGFMPDATQDSLVPHVEGRTDYIAVTEEPTPDQYDDVFELQVPLHLIAQSTSPGVHA